MTTPTQHTAEPKLIAVSRTAIETAKLYIDPLAWESLPHGSKIAAALPIQSAMDSVASAGTLKAVREALEAVSSSFDSEDDLSLRQERAISMAINAVALLTPNQDAKA